MAEASSSLKSFAGPGKKRGEVTGGDVEEGHWIEGQGNKVSSSWRYYKKSAFDAEGGATSE